MSKNDKSPDQVAAERRETESLQAELLASTSRVPKSIASSSWNASVSWKKAAIKGRRLALQKSPELDALRKAAASLRVFGD